MNWKQIYGTITENAVLKSVGPFRIAITDGSIAGVNKGEEKIYKPSISQITHVYGEVVVIKKENKKGFPKNY